MKKILALLLAAVMVAGLFAGCTTGNGGNDTTTAPVDNSGDTTTAPVDNNGDTTTTTAPATPSGEVVTLKWYQVGGGQPGNYDAWLAQINPYLEEKIGVNLDVQVVGWGDWGDRRSVIVSTNEPYDIMFTNMDTYAADVALGAFADLTDLLENYPDLKNVLPAEYWDAVRIDGRIYGVPAYKDSSMTNYFVWDADVAAEYFPGYKDAHTLADLTDGLKAIYEGTGTAPVGLNKDGISAVAGNKYDGLGAGLGTLGVSYTKGDNKVVCTFEQEDVMNDLRTLHEWYVNGYINQDAPNLDSAPTYKVVAVAQGWPYAAVTTWGPSLGASPFTGEAVNCEAIQWENTVLSNDTVQGSMACISASSAHPDKALELLQLVNTDSYVRDMLYYGVQGENWDYVDVNGEQRVHKNNTDWSMAGYTQGTYFNVTLDDTTEFNYWVEEVQKLNESAIPSPALGFSFDTSSVSEKLSACVAVYEKYKSVLLTGAMDPEEIVPQMMSEMRANGFDDIVAEAQAQLDAFLAG